MRRRRPHASAALALAALALVPTASAHAAGKPKLSVTAHAAKTQLTVKVKATAAGRVAVAVKGSTAGTLGKKTTTLARGKTRTLSFKTTSCKRCTRVDVVGTLTTPGGKPVTSKVAVKLPTTTTTTQTSTTTTAPAPAASTTTSAGAAKAPATQTVAPPTTTTSTTTTTSQASATAAPAAVTVGSTTVADATAASATASSSSKLTWPAPTLTNPTTVKVSATNRSLRLDNTKDYIISMPSTPLDGAAGLVIAGGHNVVLIGGEITIPWQGDVPPVNSRRGLFLKEQTGTVHIEGLYIHGSDLSEGIDLDERNGATVQIENTRVEGVHARDEVGFTDNHPDLIQTWAGPAVLRVDRFSGTSDYQGFFFAPLQFNPVAPTKFDLRNIDISAVQRNGLPFAGVLLWQSSPFPMDVKNLYLVPDQHKGMWSSQWPSPAAWGTGVIQGTPAGGSFATPATVGRAYRSPGYVTS